MQESQLKSWRVLLRRNWLLIVVAVFGVGMMLFFGRRVLMRYFDLRGRGGFRPGESAPPIKGWMTLPHVAKMYRVPPEALFAVLQIPMQGNERKSLDALNDIYAPDSPGKLIEELRAFFETLPARPPRPHDAPYPPLAPTAEQP